MERDEARIQLSVLIPQRNAAEAVAEQLVELQQMLQEYPAPYEVLVLDDNSQAEQRQALSELLEKHASLRLFFIQPASGLEATLLAGLEAARGQVVVSLEAGSQYPARQLLRLLEKLKRADWVQGRRQRENAMQRFWNRMRRLPRRLLLGQDIRDPDCMCWAALREAVQGVDLPPGMNRYLPWLVASRGFRVSEVTVQHRPGNSACWPPQRFRGWGDLLAMWWMTRRRRLYSVTEVLPPVTQLSLQDVENENEADSPDNFSDDSNVLGRAA